MDPLSNVNKGGNEGGKPKKNDRSDKSTDSRTASLDCFLQIQLVDLYIMQCERCMNEYVRHVIR